MRLCYIKIFFLLIPAISLAQVVEEINPPEYIKSIVFKGPTEDQFPLIKKGETVQLQFDDLTASEQDFYYRIVHCDYDWNESKLLKSQFLNGVDNQRIVDYGNSYNTLQPYSNYNLTIPNEEVSLKVSGNYVLQIFNTDDTLQFSRRFIVYDDVVGVSADVKRSRDFDFLNDKQVVQFTINYANTELVNPKKEVKVSILQNYHWPTAITNIEPQFTIGSELVYKYDFETSFFGGNEYLNFDTKDLRSPSAAISHIRLEDVYHHYLFTNKPRYDEEYTYFPDINGDFAIRTLQGDDNSREAEYTKVHFSLPYDAMLGLDNVYVYGKYNNYELSDENKLVYNEKNGMLEAVVEFKQGFYNYKYVVQKEDGFIELNAVSGNFHNTENNYLILVYYRAFGQLYDSVIGIGNANSSVITN